MSISSRETKAVITVSLIISLRLLGIFLILPVFSVYTINYPGANLTLSGVAFGIYALSQSLLQIPFGWASDIFGRKRIILIGLFLFSIGSIVCALAENINQLIMARVIQGSGAIGAVAIASLGDLTRSHVRAQVFTITSIIIGTSFIIGLIAGPFLAAELGFDSLFYLLGILGFIAIIVTALFFPKIVEAEQKNYIQRLFLFIYNYELKRLYVASFIMSFTLNMFFFIYPLSWISLGLNRFQLWKIYLIILLPSALIVFPYIRYAEKRDKLQLPTWIGWVILLFSFLFYLTGGIHKWVLFASGIAFFLGYTLFQSILPAFLTQRVPAESRGAASGFYNFSNFLGASLGGMLVGSLYNLNQHIPLIVVLFVLILWLFMGLPRQPDTD